MGDEKQEQTGGEPSILKMSTIRFSRPVCLNDFEEDLLVEIAGELPAKIHYHIEQRRVLLHPDNGRLEVEQGSVSVSGGELIVNPSAGNTAGIISPNSYGDAIV